MKRRPIFAADTIDSEDPRVRGWARAAVLLVIITIAATVRLSIPDVVVGCSCVPRDEVVRAAVTEPRTAVFAGDVGISTPDGVPVALTAWFKGVPPGPVVWLDVEDPMASSCGTGPPPAGSRYLFVSSVTDRGRFDYSFCTVVADLESSDGQDTLAQVVKLFGPARPITTATDPPADQADVALGGVVAIALGLVALLCLVGGVFLVAGGRRS
jgi:hypothetical protein